MKNQQRQDAAVSDQLAAEDGSLSRRDMLRLSAGATGALVFTGLAGCAPADEDIAEGGDEDEPAGDSGDAEQGELVFLSTQLAPVEEAEAMRTAILADFDRETRFIGEEEGPFIDRVQAESSAGDGSVAVLGGLHGHFSSLHANDLLEDLSDLAEELADRGFNRDFLELASFGGSGTFYIPWMQATYVMVARREALDYLPEGASLDSLTYEQWGAWGAAIQEETGSGRLGFPAADDGLLHRFFQGFSYPSYTGRLNTAFRSDGGEQMWQWMQQTWAHANPQSVSYGFMQEPLLSGEVWVGWDHVARLIEAMRTDPDNFVAFPSPRGPEGLGYMPVVAGLAIPKASPDPEGARALIEYLTRPEVSATTLREVGFYPATEEVDLPADLDAGIGAQAEAVAAQGADAAAVLSMLPDGLGEQGGAYNEVFRTTFERIALDNEDPRTVIDEEAENLQGVLDTAEASCWQPDPTGDGVCQVG